MKYINMRRLNSVEPDEFWCYVAQSVADEGWIGLSGMSPRVRVMTNTDLKMVENFRDALVRYGFEAHIRVKTPKHGKIQWDLQFEGVSECLSILPMISFYITSERKRYVGDLLWEFCQDRVKGEPYTVREREIKEEIKKLNV